MSGCLEGKREDCAGSRGSNLYYRVPMLLQQVPDGCYARRGDFRAEQSGDRRRACW